MSYLIIIISIVYHNIKQRVSQHCLKTFLGINQVILVNFFFLDISKKLKKHQFLHFTRQLSYCYFFVGFNLFSINSICSYISKIFWKNYHKKYPNEKLIKILKFKWSQMKKKTKNLLQMKRDHHFFKWIEYFILIKHLFDV